MMCLEDTWFVAAFHSIPMHDPGLKEFQRPARVCVCKGASVLASSVVVVGVEDRPPFGDLASTSHSQTKKLCRRCRFVSNNLF